MHCPFCSHPETKVIDSRLAGEGSQIRRRRECLACAERFTTFESGPPIRVEAQFNNTGGVIPVLRASAVPGADPNVENRGPELWFNPAAFTQPADFTPGNVSRTHPTLRNPGFQNHDLTMTKRFALSASQSLEFVASGFNFTNTANWNWPDNRIGPRSAPNANAGRIVGSNGGRILQLSLRFNF